MRRRQYLLLVVLTIVAGLVGGAVSSWVLMARIAVAEETKQDGDDSLGLKILKEIYEGDKKQHGKKIVTAEEFRLVDGDGNHRSSLSLSPDGNSFLTLCDKDGTPAISIYASSTGGGLVLHAKGVPRAYLWVVPESKSVALGLCDKDGKARIEFMVAHGIPMISDGSPFIVLRNKAGDSIWQAPPGQFASSSRWSKPTFRSSSGSTYHSIGDNHWIKSKSNDGNIIILEDGSTWEVSPLDRIDCILWLPLTDIVVAESNNPLYPYRLINSDDGETVEAKLLSD